MINHPIHIITRSNDVSSSAFIPFCEFGGNMSAMGINIDQFDIPICNSFQAKILNDQLCYEVDLKGFSNKDNIERELELGFGFIMDYNEDRQVSSDKNSKQLEDESLVSRIAKSNDEQNSYIYLNTIGKSFY